MDANSEKHRKWLDNKVQPNYGSRRNTTTTTKDTKQSPKKTRKPKAQKSIIKGAQDKALQVFKEICWYHNWRKKGCTRGNTCKFAHMCSIEGCSSTSHTAPEHDSA